MEKVRLFQDMLENLYALTPPTRMFVQKYFSKLNKNWFDDYVCPQLDKDYNYKVDLDIEDIDIYVLLKVLINNWELLKNECPECAEFKNANNLKLLSKVKRIRNHVAHLHESHYVSYDVYKNDEDILNEFAGFLGTSLAFCKKKMYEKENKAILKFVFEETSDPAIEHEDDFPPDIIESIKKTKEVLLSKNTAKEIYDFIENAILNSERGHEIAATVKNNNLKSFENIFEDLKKRYFGFVQ